MKLMNKKIQIIFFQFIIIVREKNGTMIQHTLLGNDYFNINPYQTILYSNFQYCTVISDTWTNIPWVYTILYCQ